MEVVQDRTQDSGDSSRVGSALVSAAYALSSAAVVGGLLTGRPVTALLGGFAIETLFWNTRG